MAVIQRKRALKGEQNMMREDLRRNYTTIPGQAWNVVIPVTAKGKDEKNPAIDTDIQRKVLNQTKSTVRSERG